MENKILKLSNTIKTQQERVKILHAQWIHCNNPAKLEELSKGLELSPTLPHKVISINQIPFKKSAQLRAES